jgi:hypothetical protein
MAIIAVIIAIQQDEQVLLVKRREFKGDCLPGEEAKDCESLAQARRAEKS